MLFIIIPAFFVYDNFSCITIIKFTKSPAYSTQNKQFLFEIDEFCVKCCYIEEKICKKLSKKI